MTDQSSKPEPTTILVVLGKMPDNYSGTDFTRLQERAAKGLVWAEYGNPTPRRGETPNEFKVRDMTIDENRICANISDIRRAADGHSIMGTVRPAGLYGKLLLEALEGEGKTKLSMGPRYVRNPNGDVMSIITYDLINITKE